MTTTAVDVYCCQGGATRGYELAGIAVLAGVDKDPQPRYCGHSFVQADAIQWIRDNARWLRRNVRLIHTSPPCQHDSATQVINDRDHPDLISPTRDVLEEIGIPYVIENVGGAVDKLRNPVMLCGGMFGMTRTYRHRWFELGGWTAPQPEHPEHPAPQAKLGRPPVGDERIQAVGNFSGVELVRKDWSVEWMNRDGLREAIPPAYAEWVGARFLEWQAQQ